MTTSIVASSNETLIRYITEADIPALIPMAQRFVDESSLPLTFSEEMTRLTFRNAIHHDHVIALVEDCDGTLTGGIIGVVDKDFCNETCAFVSKMYVEKEVRGLGTARALVEAFQDEAKKLGASVVFASATAGMGDKVEKLYVRLFEHFGYEVLGRVLVKELE